MKGSKTTKTAPGATKAPANKGTTPSGQATR
jgi:hypothetical protein